MQTLRKITIKNAGFTIAIVRDALSKIEKDGDKPRTVPILKITGETTEAKTGQSALGQYTALLGDFYAVNMLTGEVYRSSKCILPNFISEGMGAALHVSQSVQFAIQLSVTEKPDAIAGFEYTCENLIPVEPSNNMRRLLAAAGVNVAGALEAPKGEPEAEQPKKKK